MDCKSQWCLIAFNEQVSAIVCGEKGESVLDKMMSASPMKFFISPNNVVKSAEKYCVVY